MHLLKCSLLHCRAKEEMERKIWEESQRQRRPSRFEVIPAPDILKLRQHSTSALISPSNLTGGDVNGVSGPWCNLDISCCRVTWRAEDIVLGASRSSTEALVSDMTHINQSATVLTKSLQLASGFSCLLYFVFAGASHVSAWAPSLTCSSATRCLAVNQRSRFSRKQTPSHCAALALWQALPQPPTQLSQGQRAGELWPVEQQM